MITSTLDNVAELSAREHLISLLLPLALTLEADHFRVFLQVCAEDGISLQRLGRLTGLGQSEVIRATSVLEDWQADETAPIGLLRNNLEEAKSYRRLAFLTRQGIALRDELRAALGETFYIEAAPELHQLLQQELLAQDWAKDPSHLLQAA